jgi:23S rRNA (cytosine1962-C5)-methyltransferase
MKLEQRHSPWIELKGPARGPRVWRADCGKSSEQLETGQLVAVYDRYNAFLGWAIFHSKSQIRLRILSREDNKPDTAWWQKKALAAVKRRLNDHTVTQECCRIINAEGDDFPGLVVDRYASTLVAIAYTSTMVPIFSEILDVLNEELGTTEFHLSTDEKSAKSENDKSIIQTSKQYKNILSFSEHNLRYESRLDLGHKTSFFCDQRENRKFLAEQIKSQSQTKDNLEVLDVCCYTGGFSINAAKSGAKKVLGIDLDENAIQAAKRNANLNQLKNITFKHADAFSYLRTLQKNQKQFDWIILDPPKFIQSRREFENGKAKYHDLNKLAFPLVKPGGHIVSFSCSALFSDNDLRDIIRRAARTRKIRIIKESGPGTDHPVRIDFPEGRYLKAIWMKLDD